MIQVAEEVHQVVLKTAEVLDLEHLEVKAQVVHLKQVEEAVAKMKVVEENQAVLHHQNQEINIKRHRAIYVF
jgi:hypothetical protein